MSLSFSSAFHPPFLPLKLWPPLLSSSPSSKCFCCLSLPSSKPSHHSASPDFGIVSTTEHSDGSVLFQFGEVDEISQNARLGESAVVNNVNQADDALDSSKEETELPGSVKQVDLPEEGFTDCINDGRFSGDAVSDVESSDQTHVPETIYFKILTPVSISDLEYVVKEDANSAVDLRSDAVASEMVSQEDSKGETVTNLAEPDDQVQSSSESQGGIIAEDHSLQRMEGNYVIDDGGEGDVAQEPPMFNSLEPSAILDDEPTHTAVGEKLVKDPTDNPVDEKSIDTVKDKERIEQQTYNMMDKEPSPTAVEDEPFPTAMDDEPSSTTLEDEPFPTATDDEPSPITVDNEASPTAVDDELTPSTKAKELASDELDEKPVEQPAPNNSVTDEPTHNAVKEEIPHSIVNEEPSHAVMDVQPADKGVEDLKMLDGNLPSSPLANESAAESNNNEDPPYPDVAESGNEEIILTSQEASSSGFFLFSGVASLAQAAEELTGGDDTYFVDQNWLGIADGVGQWSFEGIGAGLYAKELMENCGKIVADRKNISITDPVEVLDKAAMQTTSPGSSTALIAYFDGQALHVVNIGDSGFIIIRNGFIFKRSSPMEHEFNFPLQIQKGDRPSELLEGYDIEMEEGDVIVIATDGLFDNLYEQEIASVISNSLQAGLSPQEIAEELGGRAQGVGQLKSGRSPFGDAAKACGYVGYAGGKLDHVTVIVSFLLHKPSTSQF